MMVMAEITDESVGEAQGKSNDDAPGGFPPVRACIFDVDGLLINSEDIYHDVRNSILRDYGRPDLPWSVVAELQGRTGSEATRIFLEYAQIPLKTAEYQKLKSEREKFSFLSTKPLPGVVKLLQNLRHLHLALATSLSSNTFAIKTGHLQEIFSLFPKSCQVLGGDPRVQDGRRKPAPDSYFLALRLINESLKDSEAPIKPEECLVLEDSIVGVEAGRRAGMRVVWVPHPKLLAELQGRETEAIAGQIESCGRRYGVGVDHRPESDIDGARSVDSESTGREWVRFLPSLERFPYSDYGITIPVPSEGNNSAAI
jgi:pseudouridine-5'-monophosphatase